MAEERILIVDDERLARMAMAAALEKEKYRPVLAHGGPDALARLEKEPPYDLILVDIQLNHFDDVDIIDKLKAIRYTTPIIVVTGLNDVNMAMAAIRKGAYDYLLKPVDPTQLFSTIKRAIEQNRLAQQHAIDKQNLEELVAERTDLLRAAISDLEQAYDITLEALGDALDLKDAETEGHSRRVTAYTIALARAMGLKGDDIRVVSRGAFLHDIGKMAIPDAILLKPGKLDRHERAMMREHCWRGYQILRKIPFLQDAAQIVYSHQEHYDGTGYPRRLKGEEIVLGARIFAVADTLDAITSDRPYRRASSFDAARQEIVRCSRTQFDPHVVEVFGSLSIQLWESLQVEITTHARSLSSK
jgi:putative nucleotidyltransferase with HDIG domain